MLEAQTRWMLPTYSSEEVAALMQRHQISSLVAKVLLARHITEPEAVDALLNPSPQLLHDPFLLTGMVESKERIEQAIEQGEKIIIYGDYDVDGVSSTTLLIHVFQRLGAQFSCYIPNRFREGYGLNQDALTHIKEDGYSLVITVDTGISGAKEVAYANQLGLELIITDHHEPPPELPPAYAIINPKLPGNTYPFPYLAGVGVAFKLAQALLGEVPMPWLQWVALGTIADLVPLVGENHVLAALGLEQLNQQPSLGLAELMAVAGLRPGEITAGHIGFQLGPRINASGRLDDAMLAVQLLTSQEQEEAALLAQQLDELNRERQAMVDQITAEAIAMVEAEADDRRKVIVVAKEGWNQGVIGIAASRLVELYYLPTIVFSIDPETGLAKGSARSIAGYDMYAALQNAQEHLLQYGGHPMAAGMTAELSQLKGLQQALHQYAETHLNAEDYIPRTAVDATIDLHEIDLASVEQLAQLAPYGVGHPTPSFLLEDVELHNMRRIGRNQEHLKGEALLGEESLDFIYFQGGDVGEQISPEATVHLLGQLQINEWNGVRKPQLLIKDLAVPHLQIFDYRHLAGKPEVIVEPLTFTSQWKTALLYFHSDHQAEVEQLSGQIENSYPLHIDKLNRSSKVKEGRLQLTEEDGTVTIDQLVLYDCPTSLEQLNTTLQPFSMVKRIYCLFILPGKSTFFSRLPQRKDFKWLYAVLHQYRVLPYAQLQRSMVKQGWTEEQVSWMLQVFLELGFITQAGEQIALVPNPAKQELINSPTYRRTYEQTQVERELLFSPYQQMAAWIRNG